jgi:hypothetical protein
MTSAHDDIADGFHLMKDGNAWCAVGPEFVDLVQSPAGFGETPQAAVKALQVELRKAGYPDHRIPMLGEFTVHQLMRAYTARP